MQLGGGGNNGVIPNLTGADRRRPQRSGARHRHLRQRLGASHRAPDVSPDWALNDEAIRNLGYMQMKKTHDAAMVLIERAYGARPRFNYYVGTSQGGREALTVAQRYPADYDGIVANVPIVELLVADARAGADSHPGEAAGQLGHAGEDRAIRGEFMRTVRRARRPGRRRHQQLHGVPRDLRRHAGRRPDEHRGRRSAARTTSIRIRRTPARRRA